MTLSLLLESLKAMIIWWFFNILNMYSFVFKIIIWFTSTFHAIYSLLLAVLKRHYKSYYPSLTSWDELSSTRLRQLDCNFMLSCVCKYKLGQWLLLFLTVNIWGCASLVAKVSVSKIEKYWWIVFEIFHFDNLSHISSFETFSNFCLLNVA